jgi:thiol-disulfide isomerase/thioredoxin
MKKLSIIILALAAAGALSCSSNNVKYDIKGAAPEDGGLVRLVDAISSEVVDSAFVADGVFQMKGKAPKDAFLNLSADGSNWTFPLINDGESIEVDFAGHSVDGSDLNEKIAECDAKTDAMMQEYNAFVNGLMALPKEELEAKMPEYEAWYNKLGECYLGVVEENMDNLVPVPFIRNIRSLCGPDKFNELLASAAPFTTHPYVMDLKRRIDESEAKQKEAEEKKQAIIGQKFLDLEEADPDGNMHKLSEYVGQGKWVLVDFWASWCGPCEAEMPNVVAAYKKYHDKGFEVVGLSFDREKEPWVKAITDWEMPWIHLSDLKYWKSVASDVYSVNSIPDNLLIDPEGTVVARCLRGEALEEKLDEIFD